MREAVLALTAEGLAIESPRRGVVVTNLGPDDADAIHEARIPLEGFAARLAAERRPSNLCEELQGILDQQAVAAATNDQDAYFRSNADFHAAIAGACGNMEMRRLLRALEGRMALAIRQVATSLEHRESALAEHRAIVVAIVAGDGDAAETAMRAHIAATRKRRSSQPAP